MSGMCFGDIPCTIGFAKQKESSTIWVGWLDKWTSASLLQKTFSQFDKNVSVVYNPSEKTAKISFRDNRWSRDAIKALNNGTLGIQAVLIKMDFENAPGEYFVY